MSYKKINSSVIELLTIRNSSLINSLNYFILSEFTKNNKPYSIISKGSPIKPKLKSIMLPKNMSKIVDNKLGVFVDVDESNIIYLVSFYLALFSDEINQFLNKKREYESMLYSNRYDEAMEILDNIEQDICVTLWGIKQKLVINDLIGGLEQNKLYLESISKKAQGKAYIEIIFNWYSVMSENKTSYDNYQNSIKKYFDNSEGSMVTYLRYKLDLEYQLDYKNFSSIIQIESFSSVIDLYLSFIDLYPQFLFINDIKSLPSVFITCAKAINDNRIHNLLVQFGEGAAILEKKLKKELDSGYYNVIEKYSVGEYEYVNSYLADYLEKEISDFQSRTIYVKSLIQSHQKQETLNGITKYMYSMYALNEDYFKSRQNILKYRKQYKGTTWEPKIISFLNRREAVSDSISKMEISSYLNDINLTPNFSNIISSSVVKRGFTQKMKEYFPITNSVINHNNTNLITDEFRKKYMELGNTKIEIQEIYENLEMMIFNEKYSLFSRERAAFRLSELLLKKEEYYKYILLVVKLYFENNLLIGRMNLNDCFLKIKRRPSKEIKDSVCYPIFIYLCDTSDKRTKTIAIANFLDANKIFEINQLLQLEFEKRQKVFFLFKVLDLYSLKKDVRFLDKSSNAEEVRITVLNWLIAEDKENKRIYHDEINEINKQIALKERVNRINKSKIFVDTQKIYSENKNLWEEDYANYIETKKFDRQIYSSNVENLKGLSDIDYFRKITRGINSEIKNDLVYHQEILMLKNLLNKILDELLISTSHGLETYLSSRIRHGYAKNHLTNVFYKYNLMSKSDSADNQNYYINDYWDNKNYTNKEHFNNFKNLISEFTRKIDTKVNSINSEWVQIKRDKNDNGLFDYTDLLDIFIVGSHSIKFRNFRDLFEQFVQIFWEKSDINLKELRLVVNSDLKIYFYDSLDDLEKNISDIDKSGIETIISECLTNINLCRTGIESVINDFSEVFEKPNVEHTNFTMSELCETALSISEKMFRYFNQIIIHSHVTTTEMIEGSYFPHFIDSLGILINNAIEHSGFPNLSGLELSIDVSNVIDGTDEWLFYKDIFSKKEIDICTGSVFTNITVKNNLSSHIDITLLEKRIKNAFEEADSFDNIKELIQGEGGTGIIKLANIFKNKVPAAFVILYEVQTDFISISIIFDNEAIISKKEGM